MTPALSNFRSAFTITERVIPTLSAILLATRIPSSPSSSSKIWIIASSSEKDKVLKADFTTWIFRFSSAFSSCTESHHFQPHNRCSIFTDNNVFNIIWFLAAVHEQCSQTLSRNITGLIMAIYCPICWPSNPSVCRFTFSFVDSTPSSLSFKSLSI